MRLALIALAAIALASCATPTIDTLAANATTDTAPSAPSLAPTAPAEASPAANTSIRVMLAPGHDPVAGRLIVVATPVAALPDAMATPYPRVLSGSQPGSYLAAQEAALVSPAQDTVFNTDLIAYPAPLAQVPAGDYWLQVRLDTNHNAAFSLFDQDNDFASVPVKVRLPAAEPIRATLKRESEVALRGQPAPAPAAAIVDPDIRDIDFVSPSLSAFWGREIRIKGLVLLPPGYNTSRERYPTVYRTEGFGGTLASQRITARRHRDLMKTGQTPPMIRVFIDHSSPWGTTELADSVNNGPWGRAFTEELIPALEKQYRMDAKPSGRFTTGHSSGGWFAIWQQVRYPKVFGGTWARAPDPVDFRSFTGVDLYAPNANAYNRPDGSPQYLVRDAKGVNTTSLKEYAARENVLGDFGGQFDSFDWVFSPRGDNGRPQEIFDRITGKVDPVVAAHWRSNYDISAIIRRDWKTLKPDLDGKIHLIMGTNDTFHLDEAARLLEQELTTLGARASFFWMEGRNHGTLDAINDDPMGLEKKIAAEMYAVARPGSSFKPAPPSTVVKNAPPPAP